jgi:hypothetical protein
VSNFEDRALTRYMSFAKFVDLLSGGLFCARATSFEDPWEGHVFHSLNSKAENHLPLAAFVNRAKEWIYVSCWHAGGAENYAMWKVYGQSHEAVAVHTRVGSLQPLMNDYNHGVGNPLAVATVVRYAEPVSGEMSPLDPSQTYITAFMIPGDPGRRKWLELMGTCLAQKPLGYAYENEVRLMLLDPLAPDLFGIVDATAETPAGYRLEIANIGQFIERITVAPNAPDWFLGIVRETSAKFGIDLGSTPIERSRLFDDAPRPVIQAQYRRG